MRTDTPTATCAWEAIGMVRKAMPMTSKPMRLAVRVILIILMFTILSSFWSPPIRPDRGNTQHNTQSWPELHSFGLNLWVKRTKRRLVVFPAPWTTFCSGAPRQGLAGSSQARLP
jgi:hypothetical protein